MRLAVIAALVLIPTAGCSSGKSISLPSPVEAGGKVTFASGQPVRDVYIVLTPTDAMAPANGKVKSDGTFSLKTYDEKPGAVPGKYRVTFQAPVGAPVAEVKAAEAMLAQIPAKYKQDSSPLEVEIPSGGNTRLDLKLDAK
ncbi:hypothetical protein GobsT_27850 [Gemmata obscuriglobus]|uniref:carboxypeptidase-like regulatory domain-containing protein n=1 Tax=Gemmata obscuriglobus TaxID=114 RepID=UPI0011CCFD0E|nr:carboxypeptidase-like regulatory domain-containing protein [Gemmata obscuriglobus]QEG28016.1 hypothetical protein GobsT_27850 [Gemmata obscuriglobus]VTS05558.1 Uncharacterized protein OS=Planctomyces maris DSM 8797 GN=PM8797T_19919 PE=4 SV=1 [Gemmata obscuriglobus UQM 2246]